MWMHFMNIFLLLITYYLFCMSMSHLLMYQSNQMIMKEIRKIKHAYIFYLLGTIVAKGLKILKVPEKWFSIGYKLCFFILSIGLFMMMITRIS
ncbi:hypothetical protein CHH83_04555 [Bacillus sp. 7586-K]|nr:hypothetical protein CHH83_04555 [Bacillus sp. 7586-K]